MADAAASVPAPAPSSSGLVGPAQSPPISAQPPTQPFTPQSQPPTINPTINDSTMITPQHSDLTRPAHQLSAIESSNLQPADARIRAYAKLEFPEFDFYIQKLSVIIGRRPAAASSAHQLQQQQQQQLHAQLQQHLDAQNALAAATAELAVSAASQPVAGPSSPPKPEKAEQVTLEDFMVGMEDDVPAVKVEAEPTPKAVADEPTPVPGSPPRLAIPTVAVIPSSPAQEDTGKGKGKAKAENDDSADPFAEFLRSSPVLGPVNPTPPPPPPPIAPSPLGQPSTHRSPLRAASTLPNLPAMSSALSPRTLSLAELAAAPLVAQAPAQAAAVTTDIDLGPIRAVSRQHARLYFDYELGGWAIEVLGRNGVVVEGKWKAKGEREPLSKRTKIQIAERIFHFVLPQLEPVASIAPDSLEALSPLTEPISDDELSSLSDDSDEDEPAKKVSDDDSGLSDDSSSSLSSLSSLSDSDIELSPLRTAADPGDEVPRLDLGPRKAPSKKAPSKAPRKAQYGQVAGKRLDMLQAVRNGGVGTGGKGGGRGKMGGMGTGGKGGGGGKKAPRKGKSVPSRPYWEHDDDDNDSDSEDDSDEVESQLLPPHKAPAAAANTYPATYGGIDFDDPFAEELEEQDDDEDADFGAPKSHKKGQGKNASRSNSMSVPPAQPAASTSGQPGVVPAADPAAEGPAVPKPKVSHKKREIPWVPLPPRPPSPIILDRPRIRKLVIKPQPAPEPPARKAPKKTQAGKMPKKGPAANGAELAFGGGGQVKVEGQFAGVYGTVLPNGQIKRPRGRPPKNGICAQRPRKPKPPVQTMFPNQPMPNGGGKAWPAHQQPQQQQQKPQPQQGDEESSDLSSGEESESSEEEEDVKPTPPAHPVMPTPPPIVAPTPRAPAAGIPGFTKMSWIAQGNNANALAVPGGPAAAAKPSAATATEGKPAATVEAKEPSPAPAKAAAAPTKAKSKSTTSPVPDPAPAEAAAPLGPYDLPPGPGHPSKTQASKAPKPSAAGPTVHPKVVESARTIMGNGPDGVDELQTKPTHSYASLVAQAINAQESRKCSQQGIFDFIARRWPWYGNGEVNQPGWQHAIKHNMTMSKGFIRVSQEDKGAPQLYMVDPEAETSFDGLTFRKKQPPKPPAAPGAASASATPTPTPAAATPAPAASRPASAQPRPAAKPGTPSASPLAVPLPILVCPIPDSYTRPVQPAASGPPPDELTAQLLKDPPIILHEGKLIVNPDIFASFPKAEIDRLSAQPASVALPILQQHVVKHFKARMDKKEADKAAAAAANGAAAGGSTKRKLEEPAAGEGASKVAKTESVAELPV